MNVSEAIHNRRSIRAFLDKAVEREQILQLLDTARWAPSGSNIQPWQVTVLMGDAKNRLQQRLAASFRQGMAAKRDYTYYPVQWVEPYQARRKACGLQLYRALQIGRDDTQRRTEQWLANYHSFNAPVLLLFFMDNVMETGSFLDYGMFLQSLMLAAVEQGLATCPQAALCDYADVVRDALGYDSNKVLVCGMALGYPDLDAPINQYRTPREMATHFTQFLD